MFAKFRCLFSPSESQIRPDQIPRPYHGPAHAGAYLLSNRIVIVASARVPAGFYLDCAPCTRIELPASDEALGRAINEALDAFRRSYVVGDDYARLRKAQLREFGVRSERQLQQQALHCWFTRDSDEFKFEPTHSGGTAGDQKGFQPNGRSFGLPRSSSHVEIGRALRQALSLCTTVYDDQNS